MHGAFNKKRLYLMLVPLVLIIALIALLYSMDRNRIIETLKKHQIETINIASRALDNELSRIVSDISFLAQQPQAEKVICPSRVAPCQRWRTEFANTLSIFALEKGLYSQIRVVGANGFELLRVKSSISGIFESVREGALQDVSDRYYVKQGMLLKPGQIYVSLFDLNIEYGQIERPFSPTIRFVAPIYKERSVSPEALIILNYDGQQLLDLLEDIGLERNSEIWLVNQDDYFMRAPAEQDEWGFMFENRSHKTIDNILPGLKQQLEQAIGNTLIKNERIYAHSHICDQGGCIADNLRENEELEPIIMPFHGSDFPWVLISRSEETDQSFGVDLNNRWLWLYMISALLAAISAITGFAAWQFSSSLDKLSNEKGKTKDAKNLLNAFIDNAPFPVYLKDQAGKYLLINQAYATHLAHPEDKILGHTDFDLRDEKVLSDQISREQQVIHSNKKVITDEYWSNETRKHQHYRVTRFPVKRLDQKEVHVGSIALDMTDLDQAEANLEERQILLETLIESAPYGLLLTDVGGTINFTNNRLCEMFGYEKNELAGQKIEMLVPDYVRASHVGKRSSYEAMPDHTRRTMGGQGLNVHGRKKNGDQLSIDVVLCSVIVGGKKMTMSIIKDVSERARLEEHIRQSQKMDAIGQLSGGIAHDFNNLLGVIIGNLDLLEQVVSGNDKAERRVKTALKAALGGAELTKRLLAFSRKQALNPQPTLLQQELEEMRPILERTLKSSAELIIKVDEATPKVLIDPSELQNVILNLCINARDALPRVGRIIIEVKETELEQEFIAQFHEDIAPGRYVQLVVSDNGKGMSKETITHIFEPFFTTKEKGKGTGLGLAMVHGFVRQSKGMIKVYSEENLGTAFHLYLPAVDDGASPLPAQSTDIHINLSGGNERILVVDDETDLSEITQVYLDDLGYSTAVASSAEEAIVLIEGDDSFDLVLTDIVMPGGMDGLELYDAVHIKFPTMKFIFASGFSEEALKARQGGQLPAVMINKPYDRQTLASTVRNVLDGDD